ncbi:MAG: S9 family peptidase [Acidobacteriota bacterium]
MTSLPPPSAPRDVTVLEEHGRQRSDPYFWLREREAPRVREYLVSENAFFDAYMEGLSERVDEIYAELEERIALDDSSVPVAEGDFEYFVRLAQGESFESYWRTPLSGGASEKILDVNELAEGRSFAQVGSVAVSPRGGRIAYTFDDRGRRLYSLRVRDLATGEDTQVLPAGLAASVVWAADGEGLFALRRDTETLRACEAFHRSLRDGAERTLFTEDDSTFSLGLGRSKSREYLMLHSHQTLRSEVRVLPLAAPSEECEVLYSREARHEVSADHANGRFYLRINDTGRNFRLVSFVAVGTDAVSWREEVAHRDDVLLDDFELIRSALVTVERRDARPTIQVRPYDGAAFELTIDEPVLAVGLEGNRHFETDTLRYSVSSLKTPRTVIDAHVLTGERRVRKVQPVGGDFDASRYVTERLDVVARDGALVPVSLLYRSELARDGSAPALLGGYGAYGVCVDPVFRPSVLSLVDRGFVYAIAHVRGGMDRGYGWYESGRQLDKKNTFFDFIDVAEALIEGGYTSAERLAIRGGSAGGLLVGAVLNERPDLFAAAIAAVPFVDVVTTMLDESVPLTTGEYDEWGDPKDETAYEYILSYSPYDNVRACRYPDLLVTTGFHDSQVQYWEPAKWVAKLRATQEEGALTLLRTDFDSGHGGPAGRYDQLKEAAMELAFLVDRTGKADDERR